MLTHSAVCNVKNYQMLNANPVQFLYDFEGLNPLCLFYVWLFFLIEIKRFDLINTPYHFIISIHSKARTLGMECKLLPPILLVLKHYQATHYSKDNKAIGWTLHAQIFEILLVTEPAVDNSCQHQILVAIFKWRFYFSD